jgi:hypothetical protein
MQAAARLQARTSGLDVFTGPLPVLYIPVGRTLSLTRRYRAVWPALAACASGTAGSV